MYISWDRFRFEFGFFVVEVWTVRYNYNQLVEIYIDRDVGGALMSTSTRRKERMDYLHYCEYGELEGI